MGTTSGYFHKAGVYISIKGILDEAVRLSAKTANEGKNSYSGEDEISL